jgi:hypothetical protein
MQKNYFYGFTFLVFTFLMLYSSQSSAADTQVTIQNGLDKDAYFSLYAGRGRPMTQVGDARVIKAGERATFNIQGGDIEKANQWLSTNFGGTLDVLGIDANQGDSQAALISGAPLMGSCLVKMNDPTTGASINLSNINNFIFLVKGNR